MLHLAIEASLSGNTLETALEVFVINREAVIRCSN